MNNNRQNRPPNNMERGQQGYNVHNNRNMGAGQMQRGQMPPQTRSRTQANSGAAPSSRGSTQNRPVNRPSSASGVNNIKAQTPLGRRAEPNRVKLTAEQIEVNKRERRREIYHIKKRRSAIIKTFIKRVVFGVCVFAIMFALFCLLFFWNLTRTSNNNISRYSYRIGEHNYSKPYTTVVKNEQAYVNFTEIAELCDLAVTGSKEDIKYVIKSDSAETIRFVADSRVVYVNDVETRLGAECFWISNELYVPVDFVGAYFKGLNVEHDANKNEIEVSRTITNLDEKGKLPKGEEAEYAPLSFLLQSVAPLVPLDQEKQEGVQDPELNFATNLIMYEKYMNPGNTDEYLILINREHTLEATDSPQDMIAVVDTRKDPGRATQYMREYAAKALEAMFIELRAAGFEDVGVTSAYRSYSYQGQLYSNYVAANGKEAADKFSMPAGQSEHQTGLAADLHNLPSASTAFKNEPAYEWLRENCWKFGFILRYPEDKYDITTIQFEPWHYRFVGRYHAKRIYEMNMCLEEYLAYIGK